MRSCLVPVVGALLLVVSTSAAADPPAWHVEVTVRETATVTDQNPNDPAHTVRKERTDASVSVSGSTDAARLRAGVELHSDPAHLEKITGAYASSSTETSSSKYGSSEASATITASPERAAEFSFTYSDDKNWSFGLTVGFKGESTAHSCAHSIVANMSEPCQNSAEPTELTFGGIASSDNGGRVTRTKSGYTIDWTADDPTGTDHAVGITKTTHAELHATITRRSGEIKYDAVLMPSLADAYRAWIPSGPELPKGTDDIGGNSLGVKLEIRDHKTGKPVKAGFTATYTVDGSNIPGWSMNTPAQKQANDKPDLFFAPASNTGHVVSDDRNMTLPHGLGTDAVIVTSRDFGAHGTLSASVEFDDGAASVQTKYEYENAKKKKILRDAAFAIPLDENSNDIADAWEDKMHILADNKRPNVDDDDVPANMATKGDGYTLFEEYRGFLVEDPAEPGPTSKRTQVRLDPLTKELFVIPFTERATAIHGAKLFSAISKIPVFIVPTNDQLAWLPDDPKAWHSEDDNGHPETHDVSRFPRWTGFNVTPKDRTHFSEGQVGIRVVDAPWSTFSPGIDAFPDVGKGPPLQPAYRDLRQHAGVYQSRAGWEDQVNAFIRDTKPGSESPRIKAGLRAAKLDQATVLTHAQANIPQLTEKLLTFSIAHEIGHQAGANEHAIDGYLAHGTNDNWGPGGNFETYYASGDPRCPQRYWQAAKVGTEIVKFLLGTWDPTDPKNFTYDDVTWKTMRLRQHPGQEWESHPTKRD